MTRYQKHRKPPKSIIELSKMVSLTNFGYSEWLVRFADLAIGEQDRADVIVLPRRTSVTCISVTRRPDLLSAIESTVSELRDLGSRAKPYRLKDRIILDKCKPDDVLAIAQTVAEIEGRELAEVVPIVPIVHPSESLKGETTCSVPKAKAFSPMVVIGTSVEASRCRRC